MLISPNVQSLEDDSLSAPTFIDIIYKGIHLSHALPSVIGHIMGSFQIKKLLVWTSFLSSYDGFYMWTGLMSDIHVQFFLEFDVQVYLTDVQVCWPCHIWIT